jgi:hypothetical protein
MTISWRGSRTPSIGRRSTRFPPRPPGRRISPGGRPCLDESTGPQLFAAKRWEMEPARLVSRPLSQRSYRDRPGTRRPQLRRPSIWAIGSAARQTPGPCCNCRPGSAFRGHSDGARLSGGGVARHLSQASERPRSLAREMSTCGSGGPRTRPPRYCMSVSGSSRGRGTSLVHRSGTCPDRKSRVR